MNLSATEVNKNDECGPGNKKLCHFYVVIPPEDQAISKDVSGAVATTQELVAIMKRNPHARFQSASTAEEAMRKAEEKIHFCKDTESIPSPRVERRRGRSSLSAVEGSLGAPASPSPKTDELLGMGREILMKKNDEVLERIEKNPRILCTESEYPTILQEGCKLNALHMAAKSNNHVILRRVLSLMSSMDFIRRIYPQLSEERLRSCALHLSTCYLNTPDKMMHDSPLHIACKFNAVECVDYLLSHPLCDITLTNYDKFTPSEVIGDRESKQGSKATAVRNLFSRRFIVPIWRDESVDGEAPVLGEVSYIPDLGQAIPFPLLQGKFPEFSMSLLDPCSYKLAPKDTSSSRMRVFASQPPAWKIMAFAGPMEEAKAREFRKLMKRSRYFLVHNVQASPDSSFNISGTSETGLVSPPSTPKRRTRTSSTGPCTPPMSPSSQLPLSPIASPYSSIRALLDSPRNVSPRANMAARVRDVEKGLERIASEYAAELEVPWSEYWKFLGAYCDLTSEEGLERLEKYLKSMEENKKEDELATPNSTFNHAFEDVINKMANMNLDSSGLASPDKKAGFCTNPKCRLESRFCNCEEVVPSLRYFEANGTTDNRWSFGDVPVPETLPFSGMSHPFLGIRKLDVTSQTDSFEPSNDNSVDAELQWQQLMNLEVYQTAPSSPVDIDVFEDCVNGPPVYFNGDAPGKLDFQVFQALKDFGDKIDRNKYLTTFQWLNTMRAHGNAVSAGYRRNCMDDGTPSRHSVGPGFVSTPVRARRKTEFDYSF